VWQGFGAEQVWQGVQVLQNFVAGQIQASAADGNPETRAADGHLKMSWIGALKLTLEAFCWLEIPPPIDGGLDS